MQLRELQELSGVEEHALVSWMKDGLFEIRKLPRGARREYSFDDLKRCRVMKVLTDIGLMPAAAIKLVRLRSTKKHAAAVTLKIDWRAVDIEIAALEDRAGTSVKMLKKVVGE